MGYGKPEQIYRHEPLRKYRKGLKRAMNRRRRRLEKRDPANAPIKNEYYGYSG